MPREARDDGIAVTSLENRQFYPVGASAQADQSDPAKGWPPGRRSPLPFDRRRMRNLVALLVVSALAVFAGCATVQRKLLFYPTQRTQTNGLTEWKHDSALIGYSRLVADQENVCVRIHGNGGQAADRVYAMSAFSAHDSVFVLEYPGYGSRPGKPSKGAFDAAAAEAYRLLRNSFPEKPVCVAGESIGSSPASMLAQEAVPPDKLVLVVPFDDLKWVASDHLPSFSVRLILGTSWNNVKSLSRYKGPIDIFGAKQDTVISIDHARDLAASLPQAKFHIIPGGHNDWSRQGEVQIRNP